MRSFLIQLKMIQKEKRVKVEEELSSESELSSSSCSDDENDNSLGKLQ